MHYNYISMHLDVCYIFSINCMLVGLDWAKPMMQFLLHVTCLCIPHAYILHFSIFLLFELFWSFFYCFFFPLSIFFFTLIMSMAPKRKSTLAWNPLHSCASSSFNHAPFSLHFCNVDAHMEFTENFSLLGIHSER